MDNLRIKFNKCSNEKWWYRDKVGSTFELKKGIEFDENYSPTEYAIHGEILIKKIKKTDVELLKTSEVV